MDKNIGIISVFLTALFFLNGCATKSEPKIKRDDQSYYYDIGVLQYKEGRYRDAAEAFNESLKHLKGHDQSNTVSPRRVSEIYNYLGLSYLGTQQHDEAVNAFEMALLKDPSYVSVYNNLGNAYAAMEDTDKALEEFKKALYSNDPGTVSLANYNIGLIYQNRGETEKAYYSFKKAIEQNPRIYYAYTNLGILLEKEQRYDEALETYEKGLEIFPARPELVFSVGMIYFKKGLADQAAEYFHRVLQLEPNSEFGEKAIELLEMIEK